MTDFDYTCSPLTADPKFKPVADAIAPLLARGVRNITVWDGNHESDVPRALLADRALCKEMTRYGKPLYVFELPGRQVINDRIEEFAKASPEERLVYLRKIAATATSDTGKSIVRMIGDMAQINASGQAYAYNPDARPLTNYTQGEEEQDRALRALVSKYGLSGIDKPLRDYLHSLNEKQLDDFESMQRKLKLAANACSGAQGTDDCVNNDIIRNVANYRARKGIDKGVQAMVYGFGHFASANDLNEAFPGVSIGVINEPGDLARFYKNPTMGYVDVPNYAYYINQKRFVKLDTQAAVDEFVGMPTSIQNTLPRSATPQSWQRP